MLNIENKYKAFHISFYPHTSLTAGLNIFEKTFHSRRKRMHIHIYTCKWTCLPAINQKSKNYNTIKVHPEEKKKEEEKKSTYSNLSVNLCTVLSPSRQLLTLDIDHSFKNGISNTPLSNATSLSTNKRTAWNPSFATDEWLLVLTKKRAYQIIIYLNWGSNDKQKVIALFIFCLFQTRSAWGWFMP